MDRGSTLVQRRSPTPRQLRNRILRHRQHRIASTNYATINGATGPIGSFGSANIPPDHNGHQRGLNQSITLSTLSRRHKLHRKVGKLRSLRKGALPPLPFFRDNPLALYSLHLQIEKVRPVLPLPNNKQPFTSNLKPKDDSESPDPPQYSDYSSSILC